MEINTQLLKPLIDRLTDNYRDLGREVQFHRSSEADQLRSFIQKRMNQLQHLDVSLTSPGSTLQNGQLRNSRDILRQLKLELRFAQRRWKRQLLNDVRFKRQDQDKEPLVPSKSTF